MDFRSLRERMVEGQLVMRGIRDERVLDAMRRVPRHEFAGQWNAEKAYDDMALPIGAGQTISQPYMVALMTELLELKGGEKVLEIGTGSGYQTAVLAELAAEVCTVEYVPELSIRAEEKLRSLGYSNIKFKVGNGSLGWPEAAPFQGMIVTAGAPQIPAPLFEQLDNDGGVIVIPVGSRDSQKLIKGRKYAGRFFEEFQTYCVFVPLLGEYGWRE